MNRKLLPQLVTTIVSGVALFGSLTAMSLAWFATPGGTTDKETLDGEVGLRGYFYAGNGTKDYPFEIVNPIHFYNLTRLQNLGAFTTQKYYFKVGHVFDENIGPECINDVEGVQTRQQWLDMGSFSSLNTILPIGGEGAPFIGNFDGQGIPIKNLKVSGYPEDIGVFGYISYGGIVNGLVCDTLEVHSLGYTKSQNDASHTLFGEDIENIFTSSSFLAESSLYFVDNNASNTIPLKSHNGLGGQTIDHINQNGRTIEDNKYTYNGYFLPIYPDNSTFTYSWKSSSSLLRAATSADKINGLTISDDLIGKAAVLDMSMLEESDDEDVDIGFNDADHNVQVDARLSLIASVQIAGFTYSRVIQSYNIEFHSNSYVPEAEREENVTPVSSYNDGNYSISIFCDYLDAAANDVDTEGITNYHHGNNVGLLAGHVDGSITNSYVYKGKLVFNDSDGCENIRTETETGLVGEIGTNVANSLDPDFGLTTHGDTGIVNFTKIYNKIRSDVAVGDSIFGGYDESKDKAYISYNSKKSDDYDLFKEYLYRMPDDGSPITSVPTGSKNIKNYSSPYSKKWHPYTVSSGFDASFNSVDILWDSVIEDDFSDEENPKDRGLGVFKIVSSKIGKSKDLSSQEYQDNLLTNIGKCKIINDSTRNNIIYFCTAEYNHSYNGPTWGTGAGQVNPLPGSTIPSYSDIESFEYPFSRDYDYAFRLDLSQTNLLSGKNFMYNSTSSFLTNYLSSILIDKYGGPVKPGSNRFGFMFRDDGNNQLNYLSSYMEVKKPGNTKQFGSYVDENDVTHKICYPENSLVFRIDNTNGANVSVVAAVDGTKNYSPLLTIYSFDPETNNATPVPKYSMMPKHPTYQSLDSFRYFEYNVNGATTTKCTYEDNGMKDKYRLHAHIFKLPAGNYVIGSNDSNNPVRLYYLAVQGQTDASIGDNEQASVGSAITNVDFLTKAPTYQDYIADFDPENPGQLSRAHFIFSSNQNLLEGKEIYVDVINEDNYDYINLKYTTNNNPAFITYMLLSYTGTKTGTKYYINSVASNEGGSFVHITS